MMMKEKVLIDVFPPCVLESFYIPYRDLQKILTPKVAMEWVERAYHWMGSKRDKVQMPEKSYFFYPDGDMRVMPAVAEMEGKTITGVKIISVHFKNPSRGLPTVIGFYTLVDSKTGGLLCVMDATYITAMRTGASVAVATKYLYGDKSAKVGIVGCGTQARTQAVFISKVVRTEELIVYDVSPKAIKNFCDFLKKLGLKHKVAKSMKEFSECDILITATPSREPIVKKEDVEKVRLINAIGADGPGKQELHPEILLDSTVIVDSREQAIIGGEINVPLRMGVIKEDIIFAELGEIVAGTKKIEDRRKKIVFDSTGIAILDLFVSWGIYQLAVRRRVTKKLSLF